MPKKYEAFFLPSFRLKSTRSTEFPSKVIFSISALPLSIAIMAERVSYAAIAASSPASSRKRRFNSGDREQTQQQQQQRFEDDLDRNNPKFYSFPRGGNRRQQYQQQRQRLREVSSSSFDESSSSPTTIRQQRRRKVRDAKSVSLVLEAADCDCPSFADILRDNLEEDKKVVLPMIKEPLPTTSPQPPVGFGSFDVEFASSSATSPLPQSSERTADDTLSGFDSALDDPKQHPTIPGLLFKDGQGSSIKNRKRRTE